MFKYETHLHTSPVSKCARGTVRDTLMLYKSLGYEGVFITNHFIQGNMTRPEGMTSYEDLVNFYFSDYEAGAAMADEIGLKVLPAVEISYGGTDFLIFGLDKDWYLSHPEIKGMKMSDELRLMRDSGAFISQAHPFRKADYIDHIRLYPECVEAVEVINASRNEFENGLADYYATAYGLLKTAGSDTHSAGPKKQLAGMMFNTPLTDVQDFINRVRNGEGEIFLDIFE